MRRTNRTLNDCEMQYNTEVGLFTRPSRLDALLYLRNKHHRARRVMSHLSANAS